VGDPVWPDSRPRRPVATQRFWTLFSGVRRWLFTEPARRSCEAHRTGRQASQQTLRYHFGIRLREPSVSSATKESP
jgi:hypothetical protein